MELTKEDLRIIRRVYDLTMTDIANILGVSQTYIFRIENNYDALSDNMKSKLIEAFKLDEYKLAEIRHVNKQYRYKEV